VAQPLVALLVSAVVLRVAQWALLKMRPVCARLRVLQHFFAKTALDRGLRQPALAGAYHTSAANDVPYSAFGDRTV
jgi:hypothetical protein